MTRPLAVLLLASAALPAFAAEDPELAARMDAVLATAIEEDRLVGAVVLVARDGETVYARAVGEADRDAGRAMEEDAIFRFASVTKPIVTIAAMSLVEDGLLDLEAPVTKYLPEFRPTLEGGGEAEITVEELVTHQAGLNYLFLEAADGPYHAAEVSDGLDLVPGLTLAENVRRIGQAPLLFEPGTEWRYSLGIDVLGLVLEEAAGEPLAQIVTERVTEPLGLSDLAFVVPEAEAGRLATPYENDGGDIAAMGALYEAPTEFSTIDYAPGRILDPQAYPSGGAGMAGTAGDLLAVLETVRTGGGELLSEDSVGAMLTDHAGPSAETQGPGWGFGYGGAVLVDPAATGTPQAAGTFQWGGAYGHTWFIDPENALTVVLMTNTAPEGVGGPLVEEVRDAVYGD